MAANSTNNVLIIGGSSGIGLAVAKLALKHLPGPQVIISSSSEEKCQKALEELSSAQSDQNLLVDYIVGDMGNFDKQLEDVEAVLNKAKDRFGAPIDHVVWTAGTSLSSVRGPGVSNQALLEASALRIYGPLALISLAKRYIKVSRHSSITLTSGAGVYRPVAGIARALGAMGSLEPTTHAMAVELAPIRTNLVVPGIIRTPMLGTHDEISGEIARRWAERTLLNCIGTAEEAAEAYLASMRCAYMTGSRLDVDGGTKLA